MTARMAHLSRLLSAGLAAVLVISGCTGERSDGDDKPPAQDALVLAPGQTRHHVGTSFQYGQFLATVGDSVYDENTKKFYLAVRFQNIGDGWAEPYVPAHLTTASVPSITLNPDEFRRVPPLVVQTVTYVGDSVETDPTPDGRVTFGPPDRDQPVIALDPAQESTLFLSRPQELNGWLQIGKYAVNVRRARVLAGQLSNNQQAEAGQRILRLDFDVYCNRYDPVGGFFPAEHLILAAPGGDQPQETIGASEGFAPRSWTVSTGNWVEFVVPADYAGTYTLLLSSVNTGGFTLHPELIERVALPITLEDGEPEPVAKADPALPRLPTPAPTASSQPSPAEPEPLDVDLKSGAMNVPGFTYTPTRLHYDPAAQTAVVEGDAVYIESDNSTGDGLLDTPPQFGFNANLVSRGRLYNGSITGNSVVARQGSTPITITFLSVTELDPADLGLVIGTGTGPAATLPLGPRSPVIADPPPISGGAVSAPQVTAGDWSIQLLSYRVGHLHQVRRIRPGQRELELKLKVSASASAKAKGLGLIFRPAGQVFLLSSGGYLTQALADGGIGDFEPGQTHVLTVTFAVPDAFTPGLLGVTVRGGDEITDIFTNSFAEVTFPAELAPSTSDPDLADLTGDQS
ncbi:MAG TPA: hypothetical protein VFX60_13485 [Micromonospora sp.]|nr:hypothetical protein [Micromonospora sp.]